MAANPHPQDRPYSVEEYLALDAQAEGKLEYYDGEIVAMAGASYTHTLLVSQLLRHLFPQVPKHCQLLANDIRVHCRRTAKHQRASYVYPDIVALCGAPLFTGDKPDTLMNPSLIIEVLSKTTEAYDRKEKLFAYQAIASLQDYFIVHQTQTRIEHYQRAGDLWAYRRYELADEVFSLPSLSASLTIGQIYDGVELEPDDDEMPDDERPKEDF